MKIPDFILTADWHLREDTPVCRTDNFWETQWKKVDFVSELQKKHDCPVLHAGDLFDHWKPSPYLLSKTIEHLPKEFYTVYGNHDLLYNNLDLKEKNGVHVLEKAGKLKILNEASWGQIPNKGSFIFELEKPKKGEELWVSEKHRKILVWHKFVYVGKEPFPGAKGKARSILNKYPQFDLIVTGDNHQSFVYLFDGRLLVNCGSLMRQTADQINFEPKVWLYYAADNSVEPVIIPHDKNAVSREHIITIEQRDERLDAYISRLNDNIQTTLSLEENMKRFLAKNRIRGQVKRIIDKVL
jgi:DNA repair exonuclease SbcCD nuclease subunit